MAQVAPEKPAAGVPGGDAYNPMKSIALKILPLFLVTVMLTVIKTIEGLPLLELVFFRSFLAFLPLALWFALRGQLLASLRTRRPFGHLLRGLLSLVTVSMTFLAARSLPLPEAVTLQYTQPLFVVALSALLLGEAVRGFRWVAVGVGFCGALVITWPKLTLLQAGGSVLSQTELIGAMAALTAALTLALNMLLIRQLVQTEKSTTITLWLGIYVSGMLLLTAPFGWVMPNAGQLGLLVLVGFLGIGVQILLNESLRAAPPSTAAPFEYTSMIFAIGLGFIVFGDIPDVTTLVGGAILVVAGLMILWRERQLRVGPSSARASGLPPE